MTRRYRAPQSAALLHGCLALLHELAGLPSAPACEGAVASDADDAMPAPVDPSELAAHSRTVSAALEALYALEPSAAPGARAADALAGDESDDDAV